MAYLKNKLIENDYKYLAMTGCHKYHLQGYYGEGITVGVIDTGVNPHPEFEDRLLINECRDFSMTGFVYGRPNIYEGGETGHATSVASLIAGKTLGVAPKAKIISLKAVEGDGAAFYTSIIEALKYVRDNSEKFDIVNISLSGSVSTPEYERVVKDVVNKGVLVVCASGNTGKSELRYPSSFYDVVSVGSVSLDKKESWFSTENNEVDMVQVGENIATAYYKGGYCLQTGTSFASPLVAGIASLIACKYKKLFNKRIPEPELYTMLKLNTIDLNQIGIDDKTGAGLCTLGMGTWTKMMPSDKNYTINGKPYTAIVPITTIDYCTMVHVRMANEQYGVRCFSNTDNTIDMIG